MFRVMRTRGHRLIIVLGLAAAIGLIVWTAAQGPDRGGRRPAAPDEPFMLSRPETLGRAARSTAGRGSSPSPAASRAEPVVPIDLPTPAPGLDRALAADYRGALAGQGFRVAALTIIDTRAAAGVRRAEIIYRTTTGRTLETLRSEIVRVVSPGANPKLALDQITVRATTPAGAPIVTVTITVADLDRWLKTAISDAEFYHGWTVGP
jgi:hypothetical protein